MARRRLGIPGLGGGLFGVVLHSGDRLGPDVLVLEVFGIEPGEGFGRAIGERFGEAVDRLLARLGQRLRARRVRGGPDQITVRRFGERVFVGRREAGAAVQHFAKVIVEPRGDGPNTQTRRVRLGMVLVEPGEVRKEQARIESHAAAHRLAPVKDRLARAV